MKQPSRDPAITERLRRLVERKYPTRGRFGVLESVSGIGANRWKNFFYKKQEATQEMLEFWFAKYPDSKDWILTGIESPDQKDFPFAARVPTRWEGQTIADRLTWVISEWASPSREMLFSYLEEKAKGKISAEEWANVILQKVEPTIPMIALVCEFRPHFTEWIVTGRTDGTQQVDPTDNESVKRWKEDQNQKWNQLAKSIKESRQLTNDDQTN